MISNLLSTFFESELQDPRDTWKTFLVFLASSGIQLKPVLSLHGVLDQLSFGQFLLMYVTHIYEDRQNKVNAFIGWLGHSSEVTS